MRVSQFRSQVKRRRAHVVRTALLAGVVLLALLVLRSRNPDPALVRGIMAQPTSDGITPAAVDAFIRANLQHTGLPGVAIAITKGDTVVYTAGYGHDADGNAITPDTPMPIGSLSKSITALAVLHLVEQGRIDLDTPVRAYLPDFVLADSRGARITVRQLLNQTSGMADAGFPEMSLPQPDTLHAAVARMRVAHLVAEPGTQFNYHNPNYQVAARLVEVVSGEPFAEYLHQHIFARLGMHASRTVDRAEHQRSDVSNGSIVAYGRVVARPMLPHFVNGSGGVVSTANDLAHWLILHTNGGKTPDGQRLMAARSLDVLHTPSAVDGEYAMGWEMDHLPDGTTRLEHGGTLFTFSADQALFPATGYGFVVLFNSCTALGVEQLSFIDGLTALVTGDQPELGVPASFIADSVLMCLTVLACRSGLHQAQRARHWATQRSPAPLWNPVLVLIPRLILSSSVLLVPTLAGLVFGNRDVTWTSALYGWLALIVWLAVVAMMNTWIVAIRGVYLIQQYQIQGRLGGCLPGNAQ